MAISELQQQTTTARPIVFFDGVCVVCNSSIDLLLRADRRHELLFAPLQGATADELLPPLPADTGHWSMAYLNERGLYWGSDALFEICRRLGGAWTLLAVFQLVPRAFRDSAYRLIARNRYRVFGRHDACRLPTAEERERFLP